MSDECLKPVEITTTGESVLVGTRLYVEWGIINQSECATKLWQVFVQGWIAEMFYYIWQ